LAKSDSTLKEAVKVGKETKKASAAKAKTWRRQVDRVIESSRAATG
jgi:hypothetical protein